jgi:arylsulfatase A-like enzyme
MTRRLTIGAAWGAVAWLIYGAVELILSTGIQLARFPDQEILGWQWRLIAMLMETYAVIGFVAGAVGGIMAGATPQAFASFTIALAFLANLISTWPLSRSEQIAVAAALLLLATLPQARFRFLASPWTVSLLLLAAPWLSREALDSRSSAAVKTGLSVLLIAAVLAFAVVWRRLTNGRPPSLVRQAALAILAIGTFAAVAEIGKRPAGIRAGRPIQPRTSKPNIVLITMDTVRADHTSLYGYERDTTPNLRELARGATLYTRAMAASDFTLPTHASMFTGKYLEWHGASRQDEERGQPLDPDQTTLAEMLRAHGYWTASTVANFAYLAPWTGLTRGFAVAETNRPVELSGAGYRFYLRRVAKRLLGAAAHLSDWDRDAITAGELEPRARALLDRAAACGDPFFLFVNYMDAHFPYLPDAPFDARFPGRNATVEMGNSPSRIATMREHPLSAAERSHLISQYDGGIAEEDASIGRLLNRLRELGLYENSLIIVTADHGEAFGEHDLLRHGAGFVYQDLTSIPLVVKYPGQRAGVRSDELASQVDLMPTVLEAAGVPLPSGLQGINLRAVGNGEARAVFSSAVGSPAVAHFNPRFHGARRAIVAGYMKLIASTSGPPELYDLATDPNEERNLFSPGDPRAVELSRQLDAWIASAPHRNAKPQTIDPSTWERLKSLGYVQ